MKASHALLWQSFLSIVVRFTGVGLNFVVAIIVTRTLPVDEAGMMFMLMTLVTGMALFSRLGLEQWILRDIGRLEAHETQQQGEYLHSSFRLVFITGIAFTVLWLLLSESFKQYFFDDAIRLDYLLWAGIGLFSFNLIMTSSSFLRAVQHTSTAILIQNSLPAISFIVLFALFWNSYQLEQNYVWLYNLSLVLAGLASLYWLKPWWQTLRKSASHTTKLPDLLRQTLPLAPISFFAFLMLWVDSVLTAFFLPNADVSLYSAAARVSFISLFFLGALDATIYPRLLRMHKHQPERFKRFFWQCTALVGGLLFSVTIVLVLISDWMLWVFKPEYMAAAWTLSILLIAQLVRALSLTFSFMFIMEEKVRFLNILLVTALIINIIANISLIPQYGIEGAAYATLIANCVLTGGVIVLFFKQRLLNGYA